MGEDSGDKTEEPTPHKIREARKKGQIAKSQEITSAIMLLVSFYTFKLVGPMMLDRISGHTTLVLSLVNIEFSSALVGMLLVDALKNIFTGYRATYWGCICHGNHYREPPNRIFIFLRGAYSKI